MTTKPSRRKGRPKGAKNKRTVAAMEFADAMLGRPAYRKKLQTRIDAGKAPHMEQLLWFYRHGKPKETVKHEGEVIPPFVVRIDGADDNFKKFLGASDLEANALPDCDDDYLKLD